MPGCNRSGLAAAFLAVTLALSGLAAPVQAAEKAADQASTAPAKEKKPKAKKTKPPKLTASGGSEESKAERATRLKRECRGQVNAGACSGYTD